MHSYCPDTIQSAATYKRIIRRPLVIILSTLLFPAFTVQTDFLTQQKKFERVTEAIADKHNKIENTLRSNQLAPDDLNLLLVAYKDNDLLEVYARKRHQTTYRRINVHNICARSGQLGPKRIQGDAQVPEGFYHIDRFNPTSNFHLSLGLDYPNLADRRKSKASDPGGDIFIHGSCVTIGCLPMTDDIIKELYVLAVYARNSGQVKIPVYIFPFKMTDQNMVTYRSRYNDDAQLLSFWDNLKIGYDKFTLDKEELNVKVAMNGDYVY